MNAESDSQSHQTDRHDAAYEEAVTLLRSLVIALSCSGNDIDKPQRPTGIEEVLLDTDADGYRYLLVRMRLANQQRTLLSPREQEIARMVAAGHPSKTIASVLNISCWTVGTHLRRIYAKLGVNTRAAMVDRLHDMQIGAHARAGVSPVPGNAQQTDVPAQRRA